jgi:DNA-binding XRE family transcriptional regulator
MTRRPGKRQSPHPVQIDGEPYVILSQAEYDRLAGRVRETPLPLYPKPDSRGNYPAVDYARVSIARDILTARARAGLSQKELAARAGIRVETLCRLEKGKHSAGLKTLLAIDRALKATSKHSHARRKGA